MIAAAMALATVALLPFVTWVLYLAIMSLYRTRNDGKLTSGATKIADLILAIGYFADFLLNVLVGTVLFLEIPREWLLSPRVARLQRDGTGYRKALAAWVCHNLLDPFDPSGCHCR